MPIDSMMLDPMLGHFRNMKVELESAGHSGDAFEEFCSALDRAEQLGQELSDINEFNAKLMSENLFGRMSDAYGRALSSASTGQSQEFDDDSLLKQNLDALKRSKEELLQAQGGQSGAERLANHSAIQVIDQVLALGMEDGMTYPRFLRVQIERGWDRAMDNPGMDREAILSQLADLEHNPTTPVEEAMLKEQLSAYDELAQRSKFGVADSKEFAMLRRGIERKFEPESARWKAITDRWMQMLDMLTDYVMANHDKAMMFDGYFGMIPDRRGYLNRLVHTTPGMFKVREEIFERYFGITFHQIFSHDTFTWLVRHHDLNYSQEWVEFLRDEVYPACNPELTLEAGKSGGSSGFLGALKGATGLGKQDQNAPAELISRVAELYDETQSLDRMRNPDLRVSMQRRVDYYDSKYGAGAYAREFGEIPALRDCQADSWDLDQFAYTGSELSSLNA